MVICVLVVFLVVVQMLGGIVPVGRNGRAAGTVDLHIGYLQAVDNLNPFRGLEDPSYVVYGLVYDFLFSLDQDGKFIPNLATSATCDASCMNWTYQIRQGVKWSDGTDFTAADVNFTINYNIQNTSALFTYQPEVSQVVQCSAATLPHCGALQTGPWAVTIYFQHPYAAGYGLFVPIIQKAQWQSINATNAQLYFNNPNPVGTGPYLADPNIYTEWKTPGAPLHFTKNPNYHPVGNHTGSPAIDNLYLQQFADESTLVSALQAGTIDLAKITPAGYLALGGRANIEEQQSLICNQEWNEIGISQDDAPNLTINPARFDVNFRRALAMATNKNYIVKTIYQGKGLPGSSLITPITPQWHYDPATDPVPWSGQPANLTFNLRAANALLNQSGYTIWSGGSFGNGYRVAATNITVFDETAGSPQGTNITIPQGTMLSFSMAVRAEFKQEVDTAYYLQAQWAKIGVQLTPKVELESALTSDVYGGAVDMYIWYWSGNPEPNYLLSIQSAWTLYGWNDNYWNNATYNVLYLQQLAALNLTQREAAVKAAEKVHYESAVYIIYIYPFGQWAYRTDTFQNWGNWTAHPYRQFDAFFGANPLFFDLAPATNAGGGGLSLFVIGGAAAAIVIVAAVAVVLILRSRRKKGKEEAARTEFEKK